MSSFEQPNKRTRLITTIATIAAISAAVAGCTVQPLYSGGSTTDSLALGQVNPTIREKLASITIDPAKNVFDLQVRNRLIFLLSGGAGEPAKPAYRVGLGLNHSVLSSVTVDIGNKNDTSGRPSAGSVRATSNYVILDMDGKPLATGSRSVTSSFDRPRQEFASLRAEKDAQKRAAEELAEQIYLSIAQNMSKL